ncbi:MAG TPA: isoprenylcysteine carboxylmethyltransferase family protein [Gammaproteobacteria bacterium]|nr:isoprenylcysteine carboxylmethyltransferase family protein [Gammaproteobacteria bacterium]
MNSLFVRLLGLAYGVIVYCFFLATLLYAMGFVGSLFVPKGIDGGVAGPVIVAVLVNVALLGLFAVQHSVMARPGFKRRWTKIVPKPVERSTFVLFASAVLALLTWQWRPITAVVWTVTDPVAVGVLWVVFWLGWGTLLLATFLINHFELFGLAQVWRFFRRVQPAPQAFRTPGLYRWVRHPIYLGFLLAFWATPRMTVGHLLFALATTGYILIGIWFEERDLMVEFGEQYRRYRASAGMLVPRLGRRERPQPSASAGRASDTRSV